MNGYGRTRSTLLTGGLRFATVQDLLDLLPRGEHAWTGDRREPLIADGGGRP
ncbi:MAG TPA: hypothetical protein PLH93_04000 [Flavobacteriales bacterium]|nr:hypothetical protein [Flavobacteriales bacterium]HQW86322.1 hypothetical protein [Flavobacteriales bacterium]